MTGMNPEFSPENNLTAFNCKLRDGRVLWCINRKGVGGITVSIRDKLHPGPKCDVGDCISEHDC